MNIKNKIKVGKIDNLDKKLEIITNNCLNNKELGILVRNLAKK